VSIAFPSRTSKDINGGNQLDIYKASLLYGIQVLSLQESTANSSSPQINVSLGPVWDLLVNHYICQIKTPPRLQHPEDPRKHPVLVWAQINDTIGYDYIH
jgi:hypothetical protein